MKYKIPRRLEVMVYRSDGYIVTQAYRKVYRSNALVVPSIVCKFLRKDIRFWKNTPSIKF